MKSGTKLHGYKFTLLEKLRNLSKEDYDIAMQFLPETLKIHKQTFRKWIYTSANDHLEIPGTAILKLSVFFECQPIEMYTYPFSPEAVITDWEKQKDVTQQVIQSKIQFYETHE